MPAAVCRFIRPERLCAGPCREPAACITQNVCHSWHELSNGSRDADKHACCNLQVQKVGEAVQRSVERGQPWQILMSQTIFARVNAPKLQETVGKQKPWLRKLVSYSRLG